MENIIKLLKSKVKEDQIIGVTMAYSQLGEEWCRKNFTGVYTKGKYPSEHRLMLDFDTCSIVLGNSYIEYFPSEENTTFDRLNLKTQI